MFILYILLMVMLAPLLGVCLRLYAPMLQLVSLRKVLICPWLCIITVLFLKTVLSAVRLLLSLFVPPRMFSLMLLAIRRCLLRNKSASYDFNILSSCCGDKLRPVFKGSYAPDGSVRLTKVDEIDIQAEIQSHLCETDMQYIISRLMNGDSSVLNNQSPMFGDFTTFPKSYSECIQKVIDAENMFASLPQDVRDQFGNDWAKWLSQTGTEKWLSAMGIDIPATVVPDVSVETSSSEVNVSGKSVEAS